MVSSLCGVRPACGWCPGVLISRALLTFMARHPNDAHGAVRVDDVKHAELMWRGQVVHVVSSNQRQRTSVVEDTFPRMTCPSPWMTCPSPWMTYPSSG